MAIKQTNGCRRVVGTVASICVWLAGVAPAMSAQAPAPRDIGLASAAAPGALANRPERVSVLVHLARGADRAPLRAFAAGKGGVVHYEYKLLPNLVNVRGLPQAAVAALAAVPGVLRVEPDEPVHGDMDDSAALIGALQSQITGAGYTADGAGVRICIVDTGLDSDASLYVDRIDFTAGWDFANGDADPEDDNKHGTHVAGIAAGGTGRDIDTNNCGPRPYQGIAPRATLIAVKVLGSTGSGSSSNVIAGIDYCADQSAAGARADVINLSLSAGNATGVCDSTAMAAIANAAVDAGVVVVASSGNNATTDAVGVPACGSKVIAVGATYDADFPNCQHPDRTSFDFCIAALFGTCTARCADDFPVLDQRVCFSNRGEQLDVVAPGCVTLSADFANSPDGLISFCGTSMAAPHVSGMAALLLSQDPSLTPTKVRQLIRGGAVDLGDPGFDTTFGYGRVNVLNSLALIAPDCTLDADCDDGDACTLDACETQTCTNTPIDCDDGDACTTDTCVGGVCEYTFDVCDDGNVCTTDVCDVATGCSFVPLDCDDGDACTTDFCAGGICWHTTVFCNDGDPCTSQHCDSVLGCVTDVVGCDDADPCTVDVCDAVLGCTNTPIDCDDGDACTTDVCTNGVCSSSATNCDDADACTIDACDPVVGCINTDIDCDDADACTVDTCADGVCTNSPTACDDRNPCTVDTCDALGGCTNVPIDCGDANACTTDFCAGGICWHTTVFCDDGDPCSTEHCDSAVGCVVDTPGCDDGNPCTIDACDGGGCTNTVIDCDDGDPCTTDSCLDGTCVNAIDVCDDGNACTIDACDPVLGCTNLAIDCDDLDACTVDACVGGLCENNPVSCDDGDPCTVDACDIAGGCSHTAMDCADTNECTRDFCAGGICWHNAIFCDDGDPCTIDSCDSVLGCQAVAETCDDGDPCTVDTCDAVLGCLNDAVVCPPTDSCVDGVCVPDPVGCDGDGLCELGEDCLTCPSDCASGPAGGCGNGLCEPALGENCLTCAPDCRGKQSGKPSGQYCCGDGAGSNPVGCGDARCVQDPWMCSDVPVEASCCGDGVCGGAEEQCDCAVDCGPADLIELNCSDGLDNDCDGTVDCSDLDCILEPGCLCLGVGEACTVGSDCCSGQCKGRAGNQTCK